MAVNHPDLELKAEDVIRIVLAQVRATLQNSSIGRAGLRIYDGGILLIENGGLSVTGSALISGRLEGSGTFDWTGPMWLRGSIMIPGNLTGVGNLLWSGDWEMRGPGSITGPVSIDGQLTVAGASNVIGPMTIAGTLDVTGAARFLNTMQILGETTLGSNLNVIGGRIRAGNLTIDDSGDYGGRIVASGTLDLLGLGRVRLGPFGATLVGSSNVVGDLEVLGNLEVRDAKQFKIPHPTRLDHFLRHGTTESPVSGVEYWGEETLPESGELTVTLPHYFEALTKPEGRAVLVKARGFVADWGDIEGGSFTVTGTPGGRFSWLVKAERAGADFVTEEQIEKVSGSTPRESPTDY